MSPRCYLYPLFRESNATSLLLTRARVVVIVSVWS